MDKLNEIRTGHEPHQPNRIDTTLADIFSLLSLFFLTIGRTKECPAIYSQVASIRVRQFPPFMLGILCLERRSLPSALVLRVGSFVIPSNGYPIGRSFNC